MSRMNVVEFLTLASFFRVCVEDLFVFLAKCDFASNTLYLEKYDPFLLYTCGITNTTFTNF